jgi:metallo-beta-lactamase class B
MSLARELEYEFKDFFTPDILLDDGDVLTLGNTSIRCVATPGHTDGTMSFFFDVTDGEKTYRVGTHGGSGTNTQTDDFIRRYGITTKCRRDYLESIDKLALEHVDIHMGNHVWNNDTDKKLKKLNDDPDGPNPFVDPEEWGKFLAVRRAAGEKIIAESELEQ